ncbi:Uncharacterised protein [Gordonia paraffinivorans]|uniref:Uncharacterized protein n=1 Tax=Gordonia paraffinivorans TaxID=175628 RepID=A0ABD7UYI5_9ACTN|nr:Uncharacterised protein [Gordonia paraffinivorans]
MAPAFSALVIDAASQRVRGSGLPDRSACRLLDVPDNTTLAAPCSESLTTVVGMYGFRRPARRYGETVTV